MLHPVPLLTTYANPNSPTYSTAGSLQYAGVAQLIIENNEGVIGCTGALLPGGLQILTAAHCLSDSSGAADVLSLTAAFYTLGNPIPELIDYARVIPNPNYTGALEAGNDLGLVVLQHAPAATVPRYEIYKGAAEIGSEYEVSGFGATGAGQIESFDGLRRRGWNTFDATMTETFGAFAGWTGGDRVLVSDFDNGRAANDALGLFYGLHNLGLGAREASIAPGDSGGPAFIDGQIAGIASFRLRLQFSGGRSSDIDDLSNASFGEFNAFTRVSSYAAWIEPVPEPGTAGLAAVVLAMVALRHSRRFRGPRTGGYRSGKAPSNRAWRKGFAGTKSWRGEATPRE
jgi:secreted trypsin-like serine protease